MPRTVLGLDLGQAQDFTALAAVRENGKAPDGRTVWAVPILKRWPLGTPYPQIVADVKELAGGLDRPSLALDATGCGRPVADLFRDADLPVSELVCVTITGGHQTNRVIWEEQHVPKKDLVGAAQAVLQGRRLKIARGLAEAETLTKELAAFRVKVNVATANESFEAWRERDHDDLVLALALAVWLGEQGPAPEYNVITFNLDGPPRSPVPAVAFEQVRYFAPYGSWQPVPVVAGEQLPGAPDFRTPEEAARFVRRVHELLGSTPPECELFDIGPEDAAAVERAVGAFLKARRLAV
jgi:hypothetical protein